MGLLSLPSTFNDGKNNNIQHLRARILILQCLFTNQHKSSSLYEIHKQKIDLMKNILNNTAPPTTTTNANDTLISLINNSNISTSNSMVLKNSQNSPVKQSSSSQNTVTHNVILSWSPEKVEATLKQNTEIPSSATKERSTMIESSKLKPVRQPSFIKSKKSGRKSVMYTPLPEKDPLLLFPINDQSKTQYNILDSNKKHNNINIKKNINSSFTNDDLMLVSPKKKLSNYFEKIVENGSSLNNPKNDINKSTNNNNNQQQFTNNFVFKSPLKATNNKSITDMNPITKSISPTRRKLYLNNIGIRPIRNSKSPLKGKMLSNTTATSSSLTNKQTIKRNANSPLSKLNNHHHNNNTSSSNVFERLAINSTKKTDTKHSIRKKSMIITKPSSLTFNKKTHFKSKDNHNKSPIKTPNKSSTLLFNALSSDVKKDTDQFNFLRNSTNINNIATKEKQILKDNNNNEKSPNMIDTKRKTFNRSPKKLNFKPLDIDLSLKPNKDNTTNISLHRLTKLQLLPKRDTQKTDLEKKINARLTGIMRSQEEQNRKRRETQRQNQQNLDQNDYRTKYTYETTQRRISTTNKPFDSILHDLDTKDHRIFLNKKSDSQDIDENNGTNSGHISTTLSEDHLPDIYSDDDDDNDFNKNTYATWAKKSQLEDSLLLQQSWNPKEIFGPIPSINLDIIFSNSRNNKQKPNNN